MSKRWLVALVGIVVILGSLGGVKYLQVRSAMARFANFTPPPVVVSSARVQQRQVQPTLNAVGTLNAVNGVDVTAAIGGIVKATHFRSGAKVAKGEALVQIDDAIDQAQLKTYQAQLTLQKVLFDRDQLLFKRGSVSQTQFDQSVANLHVAQSAVEATKARIDQARVQAPFDGTLGIRKFNLGQYVSPGTALVTLQDTRNLFVDFSLPESRLPLLYVGQRVKFQVEAYPTEAFSGRVAAISPKIDSATRNLKVRAQLVNTDGRLRPGMFAQIHVLTRNMREVLLVPQTAITYNPYGTTVFVISPVKGTQAGKQGPVMQVTTVFVHTGERYGKQEEILSGLKIGQKVVIAGQLKLKNGSHVSINNRIKL